MSDCITGCTHRDKHHALCTDEECGGCEPRPAEHGQLCTRCRSNLERDIRTAPGVIDWIREHLAPSGQQSLAAETNARIMGPRLDSEGKHPMRLAKRTPANEGSEPLEVRAADDADELHAALAAWALLVLEEHPSRLHLRVTGVRKSEPLVRDVTQPAYKAWCDRCGVVQESDSKGVLAETLDLHAEHAHTQIRPNLRPWRESQSLPARDVGLLPDSDATTQVCKFLTVHLEWVTEQSWAGEMVTEVGSTVRTLLARYPESERARHLADAKCRVCHRTSMVYHPPVWAGGSILVQCEHAECGAIVPESEWGLYMRMVRQDREAEEAS